MAKKPVLRRYGVYRWVPPPQDHYGPRLCLIQTERPALEIEKWAMKEYELPAKEIYVHDMGLVSELEAKEKKQAEADRALVKRQKAVKKKAKPPSRKKVVDKEDQLVGSSPPIEEEPIKRKRGRPKGSKNKPKDA